MHDLGTHFKLNYVELKKSTVLDLIVLHNIISLVSNGFTSIVSVK